MIRNKFHRYRLFAILVSMGGMGFGGSHAMAQRCDVDQEAILKLNKPSIGAFAIWDGVHGKENRDERYVSGVLQENGHVMAVGERTSLGKPTPELIFNEIDQRGRVVWEAKRAVKGLDRVLHMMRDGDSVIVLARISDGRAKTAIWLGFFNNRGVFKRERIFRSSLGALVDAHMIRVTDGAGYVLVASALGKEPLSNRVSEFYRLNSKAQVISKRAFNPGPDNALSYILPLSDQHYLAVGYIDDARGRKTGWVIKVSDKGNIVWQRQYPRGVSAGLLKAVEAPDGGLIVIGDALPVTKDGAKAAWGMRLDPSNGAVDWQRYFTGELDYSSKDIGVSKDGLISVMLDGDPSNGENPEERARKDFVRLLTLNPRGVIFDSATFFQGEGVDAERMILGPAGERILIGQTQMAYTVDPVVVEGSDTGAAEKTESAAVVKRSLEGWIVAAPRVSSYEDPCKPKPLRVLDDQ